MRELVIDEQTEKKGIEWQVGVWNEISDIYLDQIDRRFIPVVEATIERAGLEGGEIVLDLGTGTGAVAHQASIAVGPKGTVFAVDISPEMLRVAGERFERLGLQNTFLREGRAEAIPAEDDGIDVLLASLSLMYVIDRQAAAHEIARVLRPGGRLVIAVWSGPDECDIVKFQQTAGRFAGTPPVPDVGPGSMADPSEFLCQLEAAGIEARVEKQELDFEFLNFDAAWDALAGVTTAHLPDDQKRDAKNAVMAALYHGGDGPRRFRNVTQFICGTLRL